MIFSESDVQNGRIPTNSKHGSLCTLNMEWDNQGGSFMKPMNCFNIKLFSSDCFKEEDFKEKIFQEQNRLNRNKYAKESLLKESFI